jgi:hypothetical protein
MANQILEGMNMVKPAKIFTLIIVLSSTAFAQLETPNDKPLIAKPGPALSGIKELSVVITAPDSEPNKDVVLADIRAKVMGRLYDAGFTVSRPPAGHIVATPELRINIGMLKLESCAVYVLSVQTSLVRGVALPDAGQSHIAADVWKAESGMQAVATEKMPDEVGSIVQEQIQAFISACSVAGATDRQSDVNQIKPQSHRAGIERNTKPEKRQNIESKFVASKNSKVFHKPDCPSAQKIKPENLVTYGSRDEAIAAGKRPCERCNP